MCVIQEQKLKKKLKSFARLTSTGSNGSICKHLNAHKTQLVLRLRVLEVPRDKRKLETLRQSFFLALFCWSYVGAFHKQLSSNKAAKVHLIKKVLKGVRESVTQNCHVSV